MICFQVSVNGERMATAGIPGYAVLTTHITWVKRRPNPKYVVAESRLNVSLGGLDSNVPLDEPGTHMDWGGRVLRPGDVVEVRVLEADATDAPLHRDAPRAKVQTERQHLLRLRQQRKDLDAAIAKLERGVSKGKGRKPPKRK